MRSVVQNPTPFLGDRDMVRLDTVAVRTPVDVSPELGARSRLRSWFRRGGIFLLLELVTQVISLTAAFVIVRSLPKAEYGWYTLANNLQAAFAIFTTMGVTTGLLSLGGQCKTDRYKMGEVIAAAKAQRKVLLFFGAPIALPVFSYLLWKNGCPVPQIAILVGLPGVISVQMMMAQLAAAPLNLAGRFEVPQVSEAIIATLRFASIAALAVLGLMSPLTILSSTAVSGSVIVWIYLLPRARNYYEPVTAAPPAIVSRFRRLVWHSLPSSLTCLFESQVATLLVAAWGHSERVADIGAIARLGLLLALPTALVTKVLAPRLASEHDPRKLKKIWLAGVLFGVVGGITLIVGATLFRQQALWILGPQYSGLEWELVLYSTLSGFWFFGSTLFQVIHARGWIRYIWMHPLCVFAGQAAMLPFISPGTVHGAIMVMWGGAIGNFVLQGILLINGFRGRGNV
jgi:O-antigen/teichoic acid export membrane protein